MYFPLRIMTLVIYDSGNFFWQGFKLVNLNQVLAGLLNMADNADWRNCKYSKEEEMKIVEDFKNQFQEYDPNC